MDMARRCGFHTIELSAIDGISEQIVAERVSPEYVMQIERELQKRDLQCTALSAHCDMTDEAQFARLLKKIEFAGQIGAQLVKTRCGPKARYAVFEEHVKRAAEAADRYGLRLGLESLLEGPAFQEYARSVATSNYSFDQMFARSVRLESLFHILLESLEDGVIGINEKGEIFACSRQAEDMTCVSAALIQGKRCEEVFPYIPFAACLRARQTLPAKVIKVNSVNLSVESCKQKSIAEVKKVPQNLHS